MKGRILVVDDDKAILEFITLALQDEGYQVVTAQDGVIALECARSFNPDLIVLDMIMPRMDGQTFLENFRRESAKPVIGLSASKRFTDLAPTLGINDYLPKPFSLTELLDIIDRHMSVIGAD